MMFRRIGLILVTLLFVVLLAACAQATQPVRIIHAFTAAHPSFVHTPYFVARELGFWTEEGLDVHLEWTAGSALAIQMLAAGQINFTAANHDPLIFAVHRGARMRAVFQEHTKAEFVFGVPRDSAIYTLEDLKGKNIGVSSLASGFVPFARAAFFEAGMDHQRDLNLLEVGSGATAATAITTGQVDALGLWEVAFAALENTLGHDYFRFIIPPIYDRLSCNALITSDDFIARHPDAVAGFLRGLAKGTVFVQTNPEAAVHIFYRQFPEARPHGRTDDEIMQDALHVLRSENLQRSNRNRPLQNPEGLWGFVVASELLEAQAVHYLMGTLSTKKPVEYFMSNEFIERINDFDAEAIVKLAQEFVIN